MFIDGKSYTNFQNVNVKDGAFRFGKALDAAMSASGTMAIYVRGTTLYFWNGSSETAVGASGGGGFSNWDDMYSSDKTLTIDGTTLTFALTHATGDGLTLTGAAGSAGAALQITHGNASAKDVDGTSSLWYATSAGLIFATDIVCADIDAAASGNVNLTIDAAGTGTITIGGTSTGTITLGANVATASSKTLTIAGAAGSNVLTITAGDAVMSDGSLTITDADNASGFVLTNNTITDTGPLMQIVSTSLTSATALEVRLTEAAVSGGYYFAGYDATAGANVFTVAEDGITTIAGKAGSNSLIVTAGDVVFSDASLAITDADNAASFTLTNNTATTASVFVVAGSGAFTGSTTGSFATITASGLTTGTGIYAPFAAITTGKGVHLTAGATQTTGSLLYVQDTGANCAITSGTVASFDLTATAITGTVNKIGAGVSITSNRTTTTGAVSDDFDLLSIVRTDIINGAGSMAAAGSVLYVENAVTNTSGTVTDTTNGIEVVMDSLGTGIGVSVTLGAATGQGAVITANALTTGKGLSLASSATAITGAGRIFLSTHSGTTGTSAVLNEFITAATDETVLLQAKASAALAAGKIVNVSGAAMTTGTGLSMVDLDALTSGGGINVTSNSADTTERSLVYVKNDHASATGTSPITAVNDSTGPCITTTGAAQSTHFHKFATANGVTIWISDGTTANAALSGTTGDICLNAGSNKPEYCTGTTNWTALV